MGETMKEFLLTNDGNHDVRFVGEEIAFVASDKRNSTRWEEFHLYRTNSGKFVCWNIHRTIWQGEHDSFEVAVFASEPEIIVFFGLSDTAKRLYRAAGIDATIEV